MNNVRELKELLLEIRQNHPLPQVHLRDLTWSARQVDELKQDIASGNTQNNFTPNVQYDPGNPLPVVGDKSIERVDQRVRVSWNQIAAADTADYKIIRLVKSARMQVTNYKSQMYKQSASCGYLRSITAEEKVDGQELAAAGSLRQYVTDKTEQAYGAANWSWDGPNDQFKDKQNYNQDSPGWYFAPFKSQHLALKSSFVVFLVRDDTFLHYCEYDVSFAVEFSGDRGYIQRY
ncbi:hypothetical protein [Streptomyces sp. HSG2]|uniref:hypothetical protein n=1 Tax=Streptomyces sp. HSG2 TaxID=2797167 RepID=UPI001908EF58|nr:hypothetical protein [Streptomyces sp. HSG2]